MAINYEQLINWKIPDVVQTYTYKDAASYALSLGIVTDQCASDGLKFVYEGYPGGMKVLPTFPLVLGYPGFWMSDPATGIDAEKIVHGENGLTIHRPMPVAATVIGRSKVTSIVDKGRDKGAIVTVERGIYDANDSSLFATIRHVTFCRGDGGFSQACGISDHGSIPLQKVPQTLPTHKFVHHTRNDIALQYRLLADPNPLHADPVVAKRAGFNKPILHGLAIYALTAHAIVKACCDGQPELLRSIDVRFTSPMYPGETLETQIWKNGEQIAFKAIVAERNVTVVDFGMATLSSFASYSEAS